MVKPELNTTTADKLAAAARGIAAACPVIGGLVAEAVNSIIPNQKLDRVIGFLRYLDERVSSLDRDLSRAASRLQDERGLDLLLAFRAQWRGRGGLVAAELSVGKLCAPREMRQRR